MKEEKFDGTLERRVLIGMIVNREVLGRVASDWSNGLFASRWSNILGKMCVDYYRKYELAPGKAVAGLFTHWASINEGDEETVKTLEAFLGSLSNEYEAHAEEINAEYTIDIANQVFKKNILKRLADDINGAIDSGDLDKADELAKKYQNVEVVQNEGINPFKDKDAILAVFDERQESLISYPGAMGEFFQDALGRDCFISFLAPEKRGKTHCLLDMAWRSTCQRRKTAFFEVGDMSRNQILRRFLIRTARHPRHPCELQYPVKLEMSDEEAIITESKTLKFTDGLDYETSRIALENLTTSKIKSQDCYLKVHCSPAATMSVGRIKNIIEHWKRRDWVPDAIFIDYADLIDPPKGYKDSRDKINAVWTELRALSQSLHCLVVTATQATRTSYKAETMQMEHSSEDKRKMAHVTGMIGLNQNSEEKVDGRMRLNWVVARELEFSSKKCVHTAGCLALANPFVLSTW